MSDKNTGLIDVLTRLKAVMDAPDDAALAPLLGMTRTALSNRKMRNSLPKAAIDALVEREGINPEYIYNGTGRVYLEDDGHSWHDSFVKRLQHLTLSNTQALLVRKGHKATDIKAAAAGKQPPSIELLRDWRRTSNVDLNWVISGDAIEQPNDEEQALLALYRKVPAEQQKSMFATLALALAKSDDAFAQQQSNKRRTGTAKVKIINNSNR